MGQTLNGYFYIYLNKMKDLTFPVGTRDDLLGNSLEQRRKFSLVSMLLPSAPNASNPNAPKCSPFNLAISYPSGTAMKSPPTTRLSILNEMDALAIIPHVAEQHKLLYPFEQVYRSAMHVLVDTVCAEYLFHVRWFRCGVNSPYIDRSAWEPVRVFLMNGVFKLPFASYDVCDDHFSLVVFVFFTFFFNVHYRISCKNI